jgi:hypothetical protein
MINRKIKLKLIEYRGINHARRVPIDQEIHKSSQPDDDLWFTKGNRSTTRVLIFSKNPKSLIVFKMREDFVKLISLSLSNSFYN